MYLILLFVTIYLVYIFFNNYKEPLTTKKTCATFNCHKTNRILKADAENISCGTDGCNDCKCCDPGNHNKCKKDFPCCVNDQLIKKNKGNKCIGKKCNDAECCEEKPLPTCYGDYDSAQLPNKYALKPNQQEIVCKKHKCTTEECAEPFPQCDTFKCPPLTYNIKKQCNNAICKQKDCCQSTPYCSSFECPAGFKSKGLNQQCAEKDCSQKECCVKETNGNNSGGGSLFGGCSITEYGCCPGTQTPSNYGGFNCPKPKNDGKNLIRKVKKKYYEGNDIFVFTEKPPPITEEEDPWAYGSDYKRSYKKTINHYPKESIRFDLISPIPYNDAYIAPMGPKYGTWSS